jgi:hypothetical protein
LALWPNPVIYDTFDSILPKGVGQHSDDESIPQQNRRMSFQVILYENAVNHLAIRSRIGHEESQLGISFPSAWGIQEP